MALSCGFPQRKPVMATCHDRSIKYWVMHPYRHSTRSHASEGNPASSHVLPATHASKGERADFQPVPPSYVQWQAQRAKKANQELLAVIASYPCDDGWESLIYFDQATIKETYDGLRPSRDDRFE